MNQYVLLTILTRLAFSGGIRVLMRSFQLLIGVALLCSTSLVGSAQPRASDLTDAEAVAVSYMRAFFQGDIQTVASLTHRETLENLKETFLRELDKAQSEGRERQFIAETGLQVDSKALRNMSVQELFVTLVGSNQKRATPEALRAMQRAVVSLKGSKVLSNNEVAVHLEITTPSDKGNVTQISGLLLVKQDNLWKVKSSLP
jgi:hypothetical protein